MSDLDLETCILLVCLTCALSATARLILKGRGTHPKTKILRQNVRRLGFIEKDLCREYRRSKSARTTAFQVMANAEFSLDQIEDALAEIVAKNPMLSVCIRQNLDNDDMLYFYPIDEEVIVEALKVPAATLRDMLERGLSESFDEGNGPLWKMIYSGPVASEDRSTFEYIFNIAYHPALLDPWSVEIVMKDFIGVLNNLESEENSGRSGIKPLRPSLDAILAVEMSTGFWRLYLSYLQYIYYWLIPRSWLKEKAKDMMKNMYVEKFRRRTRVNSSTLEEKTRVKTLHIGEEELMKLKSKALEKGVSIQTIILSGANVATAEIMRGADRDPIKIKCGLLENGRRFSLSSLPTDTLGNYQYEVNINLKIPTAVSNPGLPPDAITKVATSCERETKRGLGSAACLKYIREYSFLTKFIGKKIDIEKVREKSLGRRPILVMMEDNHSKKDVEETKNVEEIGNITLSKLGSSMGLVQNGPVFYLSSCLFPDKIVITISYSTVLISEADADIFCTTLLDFMR